MTYKLVFAFMTAAVLQSCCHRTEIPVYQDTSKPVEERVEDALSRMTLEEKVAILHAQSKFSSAGVKRLGIPELWCTDGPHGIRAEVAWDEWTQAGWTNDSCIAFPALTNLAASFNREMAALYGKSIGEEARFREKDVLLGPGVNIYRTPLGGRNFEYMGEDPYLSSQMVVPYVRGVQENGVAVCVKHFCLNNEEACRHITDVDLNDRALYEIYLPAFKAAVQQGGAWSIMSSYNLYRGRHVTENPRLLNEILKGEWGFDGAVISDWGACHDTDEAIEGGLDLEFGTWTDGMTMGKTDAYSMYYLADAYIERLKDGRASEEVLNDKCRRVLRLIMRTAMAEKKSFGSLCSEDHYAAARKIGTEGIVLLKNDSKALPVQNARKILVVGENAIRSQIVGGGSSSLKVQHEFSPLQGICERAAKDGAEVVFERGYHGLGSVSQDGVSYIDTDDERSDDQLFADAVEAARTADLVLFFGGLNKGAFQDCEGTDRMTMSLPYGQDELISALADANPNIVVALASGNAVAMPWIDKVGCIAQVWYGGSEAGHAIADVFFGDVNVSGKLPFTFPVALEDSPAHFGGKAFPNPGKSFYDEGIFVGYRWYENKGIKPLFAFGHGLSYTTFEYGQARIRGRKVSVPVTNTGDRAGAEVVQLYISDLECSLPRPEQELKGFEKVYLEPGETKLVEFVLDNTAFQFFDDQAHGWKTEPGEFLINIGAASDDIKTTVRFDLK